LKRSRSLAQAGQAATEYALVLFTTVILASIVLKIMKAWAAAFGSGAEKAVSATLTIF